jgi:hypothetical protein
MSAEKRKHDSDSEQPGDSESREPATKKQKIGGAGNTIGVSEEEEEEASQASEAKTPQTVPKAIEPSAPETTMPCQEFERNSPPITLAEQETFDRPPRQTKEPEAKEAKKGNPESVPFDLAYLLGRFCCKKHEKIWMPLYKKDGFSARYVTHLGYELIENSSDGDSFFLCQKPPPNATFILIDGQVTQKRLVLQTLVRLGLPFVAVVPSDTAQRDFFVNLMKAHTTTHRFHVEMPTKTLSFHENGIIQPLPRLKMSFFSCKMLNSEAACHCSKDSNDKDILSQLSVQLIDYAALRRAAGILVCNRPFETNAGPTIGTAIPLAKKQRRRKEKGNIEK